ncbi:Agmatinase [Dissulfuribacter thermophilus]|uniref:Agmatinase n=1 Tax=Dissulfuribacter thermophilus TaxID=1156395 RepID=A0A1B9F6Y2_9BACT|nr:agmatinase [Dissulfuribacter thermophilus]OCC15697.1 Agmatinase [Dissulfuribacter thermophilus]
MQNQFLNLTPPYSSRDQAKWFLIPAPFDASTCYRPGARFGPQAIIEASTQMELLDEELLFEPYKIGIHTTQAIEPVLDPEKMAELVREEVSKAIDQGKMVCTLGGDHSVSIGAITAFFNAFGPLNIIQFDAHLDLRESYQGSRFSHACVMRRVWDLGNPIQVGIRSFSGEELTFLKETGAKPIFAKDIFSDPQGSIDSVIKSLDKSLPTYITIDLDCLDPSVMPAVGTPEPGGMLWYTLLNFLQTIISNSNIVGFDCVELSPVPGINFPEFTAARLIYKVIGYCQKDKI